jgi:hypothetical protein
LESGKDVLISNSGKFCVKQKDQKGCQEQGERSELSGKPKVQQYGNANGFESLD